VSISDRLNELMNKGVYGIAVEVIDIPNLWFLHRVEKDLSRATKQAEKKKSVTAGVTAPLETLIYPPTTSIFTRCPKCKGNARTSPVRLGTSKRSRTAS